MSESIFRVEVFDDTGDFMRKLEGFTLETKDSLTYHRADLEIPKRTGIIIIKESKESVS